MDGVVQKKRARNDCHEGVIVKSIVDHGNYTHYCHSGTKNHLNNVGLIHPRIQLFTKGCIGFGLIDLSLFVFIGD